MTIEARLETLENELSRVNRRNRRVVGGLVAGIVVVAAAWVLKPTALLAQDAASKPSGPKVVRAKAFVLEDEGRKGDESNIGTALRGHSRTRRHLRIVDASRLDLAQLVNQTLLRSDGRGLLPGATIARSQVIASPRRLRLVHFPRKVPVQIGITQAITHRAARLLTTQRGGPTWADDVLQAPGVPRRHHFGAAAFRVMTCGV